MDGSNHETDHLVKNINSDKLTIEDAFQHLQEGKQSEKKGEYWEAAYQFVRGREILKQLAEEQPSETEDDKQILDLYEVKAKEYFELSRKCLTSGIAQDEENKLDEEHYTAELSDDDARKRILTFGSLFSKKIELESEDKEEVTKRKSLSLEQRLQELNASLPSTMKSDKERMDSINRGLNRLGLSVYTQKKPFERFLNEMPKSEDEQIEDIIAQATDEVAVERELGGVPVVSTKRNDPDEDADGDDSDDSTTIPDEDLKLDDDQLAIKRIRHRVVKAQTKLAELVALLDEASTALQDELGPDQDDADSEIEKPSAEEFLESGKKKLRGARSDLKKAMSRWNDEMP